MRRLDRDGVTLCYEESGRGAPSLLFAHGWCCDHTHFAPLVAHYGRRHRVVAVDLRGHGASDKPEQDYTVEGFADDLAWLCDRLALVRPVVVGHSLGGVVALDLAARYPDLPAAIVLLDSSAVPTPRLLANLRPAGDRFRGPDYREQGRAFFANMFMVTDDPDRKARIVEGMCATPQHVMVSTFDQLVGYDSLPAAERCRVPVLAIASKVPSSDHARFHKLCPQLLTGQVVGAGHFLHLEVPEQVNPMIDRFLAINGLVAPSPAAEARPTTMGSGSTA